MAILPITYPELNGHFYSFVSIEALVNGIPLLGIASLNYKNSLKGTDVYGTSPSKLGTTRGKNEPTADMEIYRREWDVFRTSLGIAGVGYGETRFNIVVQYAELPFSPVVTDTIIGARIEEADHSNTEGSDPTKIKLTLNVLKILENGVGISFPGRAGL